MTHPDSTVVQVTGWTLLRSLLGLASAVGGILLCVQAITMVSGPLVEGPYEWLGHVIVLTAFIGILICGYLGIRCKVAFILGVRKLLFGS